MVERVAWMSPVHYEILGFFENHDIEASPKVISANIDYDRQYVSKEAGTLVDSGLLRKHSGLYELSDRGRAYLSGELDADDLDPDE